MNVLIAQLDLIAQLNFDLVSLKETVQEVELDLPAFLEYFKIAFKQFRHTLTSTVQIKLVGKELKLCQEVELGQARPEFRLPPKGSLSWQNNNGVLSYSFLKDTFHKLCDEVRLHNEEPVIERGPRERLIQSYTHSSPFANTYEVQGTSPSQSEGKGLKEKREQAQEKAREGNLADEEKEERAIDVPSPTKKSLGVGGAKTVASKKRRR